MPAETHPAARTDKITHHEQLVSTANKETTSERNPSNSIRP